MCLARQKSGGKDANGNEDEQRVGGGGKVNKGKGRSGTGGGGSRKNEERRSQAASVWRKTMEEDMSRDVFNEQMQCVNWQVYLQGSTRWTNRTSRTETIQVERELRSRIKVEGKS